MYLDAMREKSKRIYIICGVAIVLLFFVACNYDNIIFNLFPEQYAKLCFINTAKEVGPMVEPLFSKQTDIDVKLRVQELEKDGKSLKALKGGTAGLHYLANKDTGKFGVELSAGVGNIKMYSADIYACEENVILYCLQYNKKNVSFTWEQVGEFFGTNENIYEYLKGDNDILKDKMIDAIDDATITLVNKKSKIYSIKFENDFFIKECYIYINDNNEIYRFESVNLQITFMGKDSIYDNIEINAESKHYGKVYLKTVLKEKSKNEKRQEFKFESMELSYEGFDICVKGSFSGNVKILNKVTQEPTYNNKEIVNYKKKE